MSDSGVLRHRGLEAWLEDPNGRPIALSEDAITNANMISTWVNVAPRQFYTLRWRTSAGCKPRSALCEVFVEDGFHHVELEPESRLCVSTLMMDSARRISQSKTTKGWLNPPYNRFGCLRIRRRMLSRDDSTKKLKTRTQPEILLLGSLRLEIRRVSGEIRKDQVYWGEGHDGKGVCSFDPEGVKVVDNAARGKSPYIIFEFKFREDPKITQLITEDNMDIKIGVPSRSKTTRKSSKSGSHNDNHSMETVDSAKLHAASTSGSVQTKFNPFGLRPSRLGTKVPTGSYLASSSSSLALPAIGKVEGISDVTSSMGPSTHIRPLIPSPRGEKGPHKFVPKFESVASTSDSVSNKPNTSQSRPSQQDEVSSHLASSSLALPVIVGRTEGIPDVTSSMGPSTHTRPLAGIPRDDKRTEEKERIVSNVKLITPDSELDIAVAASQSKLAHSPSPPPTTTEDISHTDSEMILSTESAMLASEPSPPADRTTTANPGIMMQICRSDTDAAAAAFEPVPNVELDDRLDGQHLGVSLSEEMPTGFSHSHNSPVPNTCETDSHVEPITVCETAPQIEVQQLSEGGDRALILPPISETNSHVQPPTVREPEKAPKIKIEQLSEGGDRALILPTSSETDSYMQPPTVREPETSRSRSQMTPQIKIEQLSEGGDQAFKLTPTTSSEIVNADDQISRKGKRKMSDRGDADSCGPAGDGGFKRRITMVVEDEGDSDIEYIGSWRPRGTKIIIKKEAVKMELSDGPLPTVKSEIKSEDDDHKIPVDQMVGDYDALKRKEEELRQKLVEKMEVKQREVDKLEQRLRDD